MEKEEFTVELTCFEQMVARTVKEMGQRIGAGQK